MLKSEFNKFLLPNRRLKMELGYYRVWYILKKYTLIFESLLTTFEARFIFVASGAVARIGLRLDSDHQ